MAGHERAQDCFHFARCTRLIGYAVASRRARCYKTRCWRRTSAFPSTPRPTSSSSYACSPERGPNADTVSARCDTGLRWVLDRKTSEPWNPAASPRPNWGGQQPAAHRSASSPTSQCASDPMRRALGKHSHSKSRIASWHASWNSFNLILSSTPFQFSPARHRQHSPVERWTEVSATAPATIAVNQPMPGKD